MSQRTEKVESLIQQIVAKQLPNLLGAKSARITVTGVEVSPDLRHATVWLGILPERSDFDGSKTFALVEAEITSLQTAVAKTMTMKYVPRLHLKPDPGGAYAEHIEKLMRGIE